MKNPRKPTRLVSAFAAKTSKNPAVEALIKSKRAGRQTGSVVDLKIYQKEPSAITAREAFDQLFQQALGLPPPNSYNTAPAYMPVKGGDPVAIQEYARLVCEHVENLNSLITSHRRNLLPVSQTRFTWHVLKSKHPYYSEDHKEILTALDVGSAASRHLDAYCKYKPAGNIAWFVDELLWWKDACTRNLTPKPSWYPAFAIQNPYRCDDDCCDHPIVARLRKHLEPRESDAARLKLLDKNSVKEWANFIRSLLHDCFADRRCAEFLSRIFVPAKSRKQQHGYSRAKSHLVPKVIKRLNALVGVK
jgi:hypothetical protein